MGQNSWNLSGASRNVVEILSDEKPSHTQRSGEHRFYFTPAVPDGFTHPYLGTEQRIHRILKRQCRSSSYNEGAGINWVASGELKT
jgi:hypothetical protein